MDEAGGAGALRAIAQHACALRHPARLAYIAGMPAAAARAGFGPSREAFARALRELPAAPEPEVRAAFAAQLAPLGARRGDPLRRCLPGLGMQVDLVIIGVCATLVYRGSFFLPFIPEMGRWYQHCELTLCCSQALSVSICRCCSLCYPGGVCGHCSDGLACVGRGAGAQACAPAAAHRPGLLGG